MHERIAGAELGGQERQRIGEGEDFQIGVNRLLGEQREFEGHLAGVGEFAKPLAVGFGPLVAGAQQSAREGITFTVEGAAAFEQRVTHSLRGQCPGGVGNLVVSREGPGEFGLAGQFSFELRLGFHFRGEKLRVLQAGQLAVQRLPGILHAEKILPRAPGVFLAAPAPVGEENLAPLEIAEPERQGQVPHVFQFSHGQQPAGSTRMSGDECEFAIACARRRETQEILHLCRFVIFVGTEQADVEVVARELEVVRVAAVKSDLLLGRKYQTNVRVALEAIEVIRAALPERDDVRAQTRAILRFLLHFRDDFAPRQERSGGVRFLRHGGVDARCHVFDGLEHVEFEIEALHFLRRCARVESVVKIIFLLRAHFLQRIGADVMIGNQQAVRAHETPRTAGVEAHGGFLQVLEPRVGGVELMAVAQKLARRLIVEPHAFVSARRKGHGQSQEDEN